MIHMQVVKTGQSKTQHITMCYVILSGISALTFFLVLIILGTLSFIKEGFISASTQKTNF